MTFDLNEGKVYPLYAVEPTSGGGVENTEREGIVEEEEPASQESEEE